MITIKFSHVMLFDKDNEEYQVTNLPDEIETILTDSPVAIEINGESKLVGYVSYAANRAGTGLYFGDIELTEDAPNCTKIEVVKTDIVPDKDNSNKNFGVVTYIEKYQY